MQALSLGRHCSMALSTTLCFSSAQTQVRHSFRSSMSRIAVWYTRSCISPQILVNWIGVWWIRWSDNLVQWNLGFHVVAARWCPVHGVQVRCPAGIWRSPLTYAEYLATSAASRGHLGSMHHWPWLQQSSISSSCYDVKPQLLVAFRNTAYVTVVLVTFKFQQIVQSWYSVQVTFVCTALWKIYLRSNLPNLFKICRVLRKLWRKTFWCVFLCPTVYLAKKLNYSRNSCNITIGQLG